MKRMGHLALPIALLLILASLLSCVSTTSVVLPIEKIPEKKARTDLILPLLETLRDFGNTMAALMLSDYRFAGMEETSAGAYLYRFDSSNPKLPPYAYIVFRLEGSPSLSTNRGTKNYILIDGGSVGLVPADRPAIVSAGGFDLAFTASSFREAFNPWVIGKKGSYPEQIMLWFKDPGTKDARMKDLASLLLGAFPKLMYKNK